MKNKAEESKLKLNLVQDRLDVLKSNFAEEDYNQL